MNVSALRGYGFPGEYVRLLEERSIRELNPVQVEAVRAGLFGGGNLLVAAPTASGKTLIGELALVYGWLNGGVGVYLTPLRALAGEKYWEFRVLEEVGVRVGVATGDYDERAEHLGEYDLIVATYERFDSILRLKPWWLRDVRVVVLDEVHLIGDWERGPIVEVIAARLMRGNTRLIGLSATIGNPGELAEWLNASLVSSEWRPVKLVEGVLDRRRRLIVFPEEAGEEVPDRTGDLFLDTPLHNVLDLDMQTLVFVHNRRRVEEYAVEASRYLPVNPSSSLLENLARELEEAPVSMERDLLLKLVRRGVGFHHAGLSSTARMVVEKGFRERILKLVYATPTLAAGVNLPARRVVVSIKRYDPVKGRRVNISIAEYKQMAGRAGRPGYDKVGESIIPDASSLGEGLRYIKSALEPVSGRLLSERGLRIHLLSLVASRDASSIQDLIEILSSTFSARRSEDLKLNGKLVSQVVGLLEDLGMLVESSGLLKPTMLGKTTSFTYLDPLTVSMYRRLKPSVPRELYLLHVICTTPDFTRSSPYIHGWITSSLEETALDMAERGFIPGPSGFSDYDEWLRGFVYAMILYDWINEASEDSIVERYEVGPGDLYSMVDTASWIAHALSRIEGVLGDIAFYKALESLSRRIEKGVKEDALELTLLKGVGRVRARILVEHGVKNLKDLAEKPASWIASLPKFGPRIAEEIERQLREIGLKTNSVIHETA
ncbi:MAG: DEAD/DEAH box helicase, partial [Desulfurococcus sp.]|nr:DEAD/DEAH box helicase [Desulfurococcus sp.]